jgi:Heterokaryon incompatibility protein Het-C
MSALELAIDPETGMKNYIANERIGITTSSQYIRDQLRKCIELGRAGADNKSARNEAFIHLGAALHCLEGKVWPL